MRLYARNARTGELYISAAEELGNEWKELHFQIPGMDGVLLDEVGFLFEKESEEFVAYVDDFYSKGNADYSVDFANEVVDRWTFTVEIFKLRFPVYAASSVFSRSTSTLSSEIHFASIACVEPGNSKCAL